MPLLSPWLVILTHICNVMQQKVGTFCHFWSCQHVPLCMAFPAFLLWVTGSNPASLLFSGTSRWLHPEHIGRMGSLTCVQMQRVHLVFWTWPGSILKIASGRHFRMSRKGYDAERCPVPQKYVKVTLGPVWHHRRPETMRKNDVQTIPLPKEEVA